MTYPSARSMTEFDRARSGMYAGVILGGFAASSFGIFLLLGVIDLASSLFSPRGPSITTLIIVGMCSIATLTFALLAFSSWRTISRWQRINERPIMAWGTLGEPRRTNHKVNRAHLYDIPLTVQPPQGAPYTVTANWFVPLDVRDFARVGTKVVVRIDPENMNIVLVDWDQTRMTWGMPLPQVR